MFPKTSPISTPSWKKLKAHFLTHSSVHMNESFEQDPERFKKFSIEFEDFLFDYSKNRITEKTITLLAELGKECQLDKAITALFDGEKINETENRAVLHTALRDFTNNPILVNDEDVKPLILNERKRIKEFCQQIHSGDWTGSTGKRITTIVNIGVGGSDLGPAMVVEALKQHQKDDITTHFISNIDASNLLEVINKINFEETLFIVASKTFTTQETITNATTIKRLFLEAGNKNSAIKNHFIAVTGNRSAAEDFGIPNENCFQIWDWVCGRFSLWGSIGISIALTIGYHRYEELLKGAESVDKHFKNEKFEQNIPVLMGLISIWYINFHKTNSEVVLPYNHLLSKFTPFLQQASMESNGKTVDRNGDFITYQTGVVTWGDVGTNGQHSFHQLLHQGTQFIPCDFIITLESKAVYQDHQNKLICNAIAQSEALMKGKTRELKNKFTNQQNNESTNSQIHKSTNSQTNKSTNSPKNNYKIFQGNKPSNTLLIKELNPYNLGSLLGFYEHKVFVQGVIWNIFSFDQWGVELGKELSTSKLEAIQGEYNGDAFDSSTNGQLNFLNNCN